MSKEALAQAYTYMLNHHSSRHSIAHAGSALSRWDLTAEENAALVAEAQLKDVKVTIGSGPVMAYLSATRGPRLSPLVASELGVALNHAAGLPKGALTGPGFLSNAACCPWGHAFVAEVGSTQISKSLRG